MNCWAFVKPDMNWASTNPDLNTPITAAQSQKEILTLVRMAVGGVPKAHLFP